MDEKNETLRDVKELLEYAKTLGMKEVPKGTTHSTTNRAGGTEYEGLKSAPTLEAVRDVIGDCQRCRLCEGRTNIVFGVGKKDANLMFIGEGPGRDEDEQGIPFVGRAGQLLTKIIQAMGLSRDDVYIGNIVKCRPPDNRNPAPDEVAACIPFLVRQVEIINPKIIVCLGSIAAQNLLQTERKITGLRGKLTKWQDIPVMPTYHPAFLLRNPNMKKPVWEDMQKVMEMLGLKPASP
jgi:DNA polymerase